LSSFQTGFSLFSVIPDWRSHVWNPAPHCFLWIRKIAAQLWNDGTWLISSFQTGEAFIPSFQTGEAFIPSFQTGEAFIPSFQTGEAFIPSFQTAAGASGIQRRTVSSGFQRLLRNFGMTVPG